MILFLLVGSILLSTTSAFHIFHESGPTVRFLRVEDTSTDGVPIRVDFPATTSAPPSSTVPPNFPVCSGTCEFRNPAASQRLIACDGVCVCATKPAVTDAPSWDVIWNGTICTISESGPCGRGEFGMVMACQPELNCVQHRCREPSRIGSLELGWSCDDTLDCLPGLACVSDANSFPIHKTCRILPKTLFRIW